MINIKNYSNYDLNNLQFIGEGIHGKVYRINSNQCIKIFKKSSFFHRELETLKMAQGDKHFPVLLSWGRNFIVREYIDGMELDKFLKDNALSLEMSRKIIDLYDALKKVGFARQDAILFHILVTGNYELKMIDTARVMKENTSYPKLILDGLKELGLKKTFLEHTKLLRPDLFSAWTEKYK